MAYRVLIPGKTFLVGEYLALLGGPSIVFNSSPCFEWQWSELEESTSGRLEIQHPFHSKSPAGFWLDRLALEGSSLARGRRFEVQFHDPNRGAGGLGGSTAEFLGAWIFSRWLESAGGRSANIEHGSWNEFDLKAQFRVGEELCRELGDHHNQVVPTWTSTYVGGAKFLDLILKYKELNPLASGSDLISQFVGGVAIWDPGSMALSEHPFSSSDRPEMRRYGWPFAGTSITFLRTGKKLATHEHLKSGKGLSSSGLSDMRVWVEDAIQSFAYEDGERLVAAVRGVRRALESDGLVAEYTKDALSDLDSIRGVRAAKGCGAMGADVIMILHDDSTSVREQLEEFSKEKSMGVIKSSDVHRCEDSLWARAVVIEEVR